MAGRVLLETLALTAVSSLALTWPALANGSLDDDFDDGIVAPIYNDLCQSGVVESGGAFRFPGPNLGCFLAFGLYPAAVIEVLEPALIVPGNTIEAVIGLDRIPGIEPEATAGELVGIGLNPLANTAMGLNFFVQRLPGGLVVRLYNPELDVVIEEALVSPSPDDDPDLIDADSIALRLDLGENIGNSLLPTGSYRLCDVTTCLGENDPPFTPLQAAGGEGMDSIALQDAARLTLQGLALPGVSHAFAMERLTVPEPAMPASALAAIAALSLLRRKAGRRR